MQHHSRRIHRTPSHMQSIGVLIAAEIFRANECSLNFSPIDSVVFWTSDRPGCIAFVSRKQGYSSNRTACRQQELRHCIMLITINAAISARSPNCILQVISPAFCPVRPTPRWVRLMRSRPKQLSPFKLIVVLALSTQSLEAPERTVPEEGRQLAAFARLPYEIPFLAIARMLLAADVDAKVILKLCEVALRKLWTAGIVAAVDYHVRVVQLMVAAYVVELIAVGLQWNLLMIYQSSSRWLRLFLFPVVLRTLQGSSALSTHGNLNVFRRVNNVAVLSFRAPAQEN
ncbi:hypothetical protein KC359_g203 [Hortaea werneckii]|nr:hypothetical protein KC359_g203 [Hortaea werneckii]